MNLICIYEFLKMFNYIVHVAEKNKVFFLNIFYQRSQLKKAFLYLVAFFNVKYMFLCLTSVENLSIVDPKFFILLLC